MPLVAPPINFDAIRTTLWQCVQTATGLEANSVVASQPEAPIAKRPETPFCEFMVTTVAQSFGEDYELADAQEGVFRYEGPRLMTVQFQTYGETHEQAYGIACALQASLVAPPIADALKAAGVVVWSRDSVVDVSALLSTGYEGRAAFNVSFGLHSSLSVNVGTIASVPVTATLPSFSQPLRADFTVDLTEGE